MITLFEPKTIAVIGASSEEKTVGNDIVTNLLSGGVFKTKYCKPFKGKIFLVNPNHKKILNKPCYKNVNDIKENIDLAIIAVKSFIVPEILKDCIKKKIKYAIIISAGFSETGKKGIKLQNKIKQYIKKIRIIGPNCLGIINTENNLNASFAPSMPPKGHIAFISQSGALADSVIDWSIEQRYGFSKIISYGNAIDLNETDFLEYLLNDKETKVITMYIESIKNGIKFMRVAKKVSRVKPIIIIKAGKSEEGKKAISSHTGSLSSNYEIYKAAFKQSNIVEANTVEALFDIAKALEEQPRLRKNSIAIITNGGGPGVLASDYCSYYGIKLAKIKRSIFKKLDKKLHPAYSRNNPLDIVGDALPEHYEIAINELLKQNNIYGLIVIQTLQTMTNTMKDAQIVINAHKKYPSKPIICVYMGGKFSKNSINLLERHNIPDFNDPEKAVKAMKALL